MLIESALDINGMLPDPMAVTFRKYTHCEPIPPLIVRGTFIRTKAIDNALLRLVSSVEGPVQVISLGAGFDTRWGRLAGNLMTVKRYVEVDFEEIVHKKMRILDRQSSSSFSMIPFDLEQPDQQLLTALLKGGVDTTMRTIFISECCLMYLVRDRVKNLLSFLSTSFATATFILYDALFIRGDRFSTTMIDNFARRTIILDPFWLTSATDLIPLWRECGWVVRACELMSKLENSEFLIDADRAILRAKSALDEYEEWQLISSHYYFAILDSMVGGRA